MPRLFILLSLLSVGAGSASAQEPEGALFGEEVEVRAVDVVVELPAAPLRRLAGRAAPGREELAAEAEGEPVSIVAVAEAPARLDHLVLYFDLALSDDQQVEWAADLLAGRAAELVALADVEVVVASPRAVTLLPPTGDAGALEEALARLRFFSQPQDDLVEGRFRDGARGDLVTAEIAQVRQSLDELLLSLVDRSVPGPDAGLPLRGVLLVSGGFDLALGGGGGADAGLDAAAREVGRVLAAYGWRLVPLLAPEAAGPKPGLRLGKWRIGPGPGAVYEEDRDPELAEAHLELARALRDQGRLEAAIEDAERAVHHFAGAPRTAEREAEALLLLAELWDAEGDRQRARRAFRRAARFAPERTAAHPWARLLPVEPERALAVVAEAGGGELARSERELQGELAGLLRRTVVTLQLALPADDGLHRIEIRRDGGEATPAWARSGTPAAVAAARARR